MANHVEYYNELDNSPGRTRDVANEGVFLYFRKEARDAENSQVHDKSSKRVELTAEGDVQNKVRNDGHVRNERRVKILR